MMRPKPAGAVYAKTLLKTNKKQTKKNLKNKTSNLSGLDILIHKIVEAGKFGQDIVTQVLSWL